jgi:alkylated DNA nucleotide flippase Atl1
VASLDFGRASWFIAAIPTDRWAAYQDVAHAAGNKRGAQAVGTWLARHGDAVPLDYRVLTVKGRMPDASRSSGPDAPHNAAAARERLQREGVAIDAHGRAARHQRFTADQWHR